MRYASARMHQRRRYAVGADAPVPVTTPNAPASARTPNFTIMAARLMAVTAIPWVPALVGAFLAPHLLKSKHAAAYGIASGTLISLLALRAVAKNTAGVIT